MAIEQMLEQLLGRGTTVGDGRSIEDQTSSALTNSGLVAAVRDGFASQGMALASLAAALGASIDALREELRSSNRYLSSIESSIANPLEAAARELQRRGLTALERGWYPEAVEAFEQAIEKSPLSFELHMATGLARQGAGEGEAARTSFEKTQRYASVDAPAAAVGAALLMAALADDDQERQVALLRSAIGDFPDNAEVLFRLATIEEDLELLKRSIWIAPELAVVARRLFPVDPTPAVVEALGEGGPIAVALRVRDLLEAFSATFQPRVEIRWKHEIGREDLDLIFLAASETIDYLRNKISDLYELSRYAVQNGQTGKLTERLQAMDELIEIRDSSRRLAAWTDVSSSAKRVSKVKHDSVWAIVRSNGLVVPGAQDPTDPDRLDELTGEVVGHLKRGDVRRAEQLVNASNPRLHPGAAVFALGQIMKQGKV